MDNRRDEVVEVLVEEEEKVTLPGFRFHPTDEELVRFYLRRKVERKPIGREIIKQVDIYKYDPWDLPISNVGDEEWYFFCLRGRKYRNSIRPNRVTGSGFWKATGIDRPIYAAGENNDCVGLKKSLVYYRGSAGKGTKTDWMMHEFRLPSGGAGGKINGVNNSCIQEGETWTVCRIFKRTVSYKRHPQAQSCKNASTKQVLTGLSSKACSSESTSDDEYYKQLLASTFQQSDNSSVITCYEDKVQSNAGQWNSPPTQAPSPASHFSFPGSNANDSFYRDGSWDELGRIVEFPVDPWPCL